jgi:hypothetical protein
MMSGIDRQPTEGAMSDSSLCRDPSLHHLHFCKLKKKGMTAEIAARTAAPAFVCHNCGARADREADLCNPSPLPK